MSLRRKRLAIPIVIRKSGEKFIPAFPLDMNEGDRIILAKEVSVWECPQGRKVTITGFTDSGPAIMGG